MAAASLFLIGPRGCGKSGVGQLVAGRLGLDLHDTDLLVEAESGQSIDALVRDRGWAAFRELESAALARAAALGGVVATGGGVVLEESNRALMRQKGLVVYLSVPPALLCERLAQNPDPARRPSLTGADPLEEIQAVLALRESLYRESAHHTLDAAGTPEDAAGAVVRLFTAALPTRQP